MSWVFVTSSLRPTARPPPSRICSAACSTWSCDRAQHATSAPAAPNASAMARPIPRLAPVTRATRPFSENQSRIRSARAPRFRRDLLLDELAQSVFLDFPARCHRELGDDFEPLRELLFRELLGVQVRHQLVEGDRLPRPRDDERA